MDSPAETTCDSNALGAPTLLVDVNAAGIAPPNTPLPVPEIPPSIPPEIPDTTPPFGVPAPTESPVPVREPPVTLPLQS